MTADTVGVVVVVAEGGCEDVHVVWVGGGIRESGVGAPLEMTNLQTRLNGIVKKTVTR